MSSGLSCCQSLGLGWEVRGECRRERASQTGGRAIITTMMVTIIVYLLSAHSAWGHGGWEELLVCSSLVLRDVSVGAPYPHPRSLAKGGSTVGDVTPWA